jgi:hypothetical protein
MSACLFDCSVDECIKKYGRPNESQSKKLEEILVKYISATESRLDSAMERREMAEKASINDPGIVTPSQQHQEQYHQQQNPPLEPQFSIELEDLLTLPLDTLNTTTSQQAVDFDLDFDYNPADNQTFDASQLDNVLSTFDQTMNTTTTTIPASVGFRTQLEESTTTAPTDLTELKPVKSSALASQMAAEVLEQQFLAADEVVVAQSKQSASSIKIVKNNRKAQPKPIIAFDEVDTVDKKASKLVKQPQSSQPVKIMSKQAAAQQSSGTLLPWEIKNKPLKSIQIFLSVHSFLLAINRCFTSKKGNSDKKLMKTRQPRVNS